jgi:hypothetical protein
VHQEDNPCIHFHSHLHRRQRHCHYHHQPSTINHKDARTKTSAPQNRVVDYNPILTHLISQKPSEYALATSNPSTAPIHSLSHFQNLPTRRIAQPLPNNLARHVEPPIRKNPPPYELASPCSSPPLPLPSIPIRLPVPEFPRQTNLLHPSPLNLRNRITCPIPLHLYTGTTIGERSRALVDHRGRASQDSHGMSCRDRKKFPSGRRREREPPEVERSPHFFPLLPSRSRSW